MHNANRLHRYRGGVERKRSVINCKMPRIPAGHMRITDNPRPSFNYVKGAWPARLSFPMSH